MTHPTVKATAVFLLVVSLILSVGHAIPHDQEGEKSIGNSAGAGVGGNGPWESLNMTLLAHLPLDDIGGGPSNVLSNDCWGWTDPDTGKEYVVFGLTNATSFIDVSDPTDPKYLGKLPTQTGNRSWRDMKVYGNHVYVVADGNGEHGMQIFDLTQLRDADPENPTTFSNTNHIDTFNRAHNIVINEDTGYAYIVGSEVASGGLRAYDLIDPANPVHVGDFSADGYTHDAQVVIYHGPDEQHYGKEIAFNFNEDTLTIVDVSDKSNMTQLSRQAYADNEYCHQGWLSEDHRFVYMDDELDEWRADDPIQTRTRIWDVQDLDNPVYIGDYDGTEMTIDHNLYVKHDYMFQANYTSSLRVVKVNDAGALDFEEYGFFDSYNTDNDVSFNGAWSCYPFFESDIVIISDRQNGLFVVKMNQAIFEPSLVTITHGEHVSGDATDMEYSDDFKYRFLNEPRKDSMGQLEVSAICPVTDPASITFTLEANLDRPAAAFIQRIEWYDYSRQRWETIDQRRPSSNEDAKVEARRDRDLDRFIHSSGLMEARISFNTRRYSINPQHTISIDTAKWTVEEETVED